MISVIISVYNVELYLERCVRSILEQTHSDLEVILVDDGSSDTSGKMCDEFARIDKRVVVIHKENGGNASARNAGIDAAKGEFLTFVDSDDYVELDMYEKMLAEMKDKDVSIVCCGMIVTDIEGNNTVQARSEKIFLSKEEALYDFFARNGNVKPSACNKVYRREIFDSGVRYNNAVIHEDTEAMPRFIDAAEKIVVMDKAFYHYIKRKNSARTSRYFNLRGYHILDTMGDYEKMCRRKYPSILPCFLYYDLITTYEMLLDLNGCVDRRKYFQYEILLRFKILKSILKCMRWKEVREENINQIKVMLANAVLGVDLTKTIFRIN